jgi:hypothetical protein
LGRHSTSGVVRVDFCLESDRTILLFTVNNVQVNRSVLSSNTELRNGCRVDIGIN